MNERMLGTILHDPFFGLSRNAVRWELLLVARYGAGNVQTPYRNNIPVAERRYATWLAGGYDDEEVFDGSKME